MKIATGVVLAVLAAGSCWAGDLYKWTDENGITRYSDQMPGPNAKKLKKLKSSANTLSAEKAPAPVLPEQTRKAAKKYPVTLYSFSDCGDTCKQAESFLDKRGVPYTLKNADEDKLELKKLTGKLSVPTLVLGNTEPVIGFDESRWNKELDLAGYAQGSSSLKPGTSLAIKPAKPAGEAPADKSTAEAAR
jgi:glutaredoxin